MMERKWTDEDYQQFYEERAAIAEYDGKLSREQAEIVAEQAKQQLIDSHLRRIV